MECIVSIIMPVYNAEKFLNESIDSILSQTFKEFEFLIFDDGSTDNSLKIINSYNDSRIKVYSSPVNVGYVKYLNKGIEIAKGKYIARMDADDISLPTRLQEQIDFMEKNPEIGVCGTWVREFGQGDKICKLPSTHEEMRVSQLYFTPIIHPTVIFRKSVIFRFNLRYLEEFLFAKDTEFWVRLSNVTRLANLPKILLKYRTHDKNVTKTKWDSHQFHLIKQIRLKQYETLLGRKMNCIETKFINEEMEINYKNLFTISKFFADLKLHNNKFKTYQKQIFNQFLNERILGMVSGKRRVSFDYFWGAFMFPYLFPAVFFQKRIYIRAYQKIKNCFNP